MIDLSNLRIITEKELRESLRNRWFIVFTLAFGGLALLLSSLSQPSGAQIQLASYSRTAAGLVNLVLLFVPLIGLTLGATNLATDRETGALTYLLAQPLNRIEVLLGKYLGIACALLATLTLGFGVAGLAMATQGSIQDASSYLMTVGLAYLLALAMLSLGFFCLDPLQQDRYCPRWGIIPLVVPRLYWRPRHYGDGYRYSNARRCDVFADELKPPANVQIRLYFEHPSQPRNFGAGGLIRE